MLEVTSSAEENRLGVDFAEIYRGSSLYQYVYFFMEKFVQLFVGLYKHTMFFFRYNQELVERLNKPSSNSKELHFPTKYCRSSFEQFLTCLWKQNLSYWRNPQYTAVRFFYTVIISMMLGTICWRFGAKRSFPLSFPLFYGSSISNNILVHMLQIWVAYTFQFFSVFGTSLQCFPAMPICKLY